MGPSRYSNIKGVISMSIVDKIKALLRKTTENGASEAEAIAAAQKARELMDKHNVNVTPEETAERKARETKIKSQTKRRDQINSMAGSIARYCDCKVIFDNHNPCYIGLPEDVEMAEAMFIMLRDAANSEWKRFIKLPEYTTSLLEANNNRNAVQRLWRRTFANRIAVRIEDLQVKRKETLEQSNSTALVIVKTEIVNDFIAENYPSLRMIRRLGLRTNSDHTRSDALAAANRTEINRRVS